MSAPSSTSSSASRTASSPVGRVHLVAAAVAERRRRVGGLAERAIEGGGELGRVGDDRRVLETLGVQLRRGARPLGRPSCRWAPPRRPRRGRGRWRSWPAARRGSRCPRCRRRDQAPQWPCDGVLAQAHVGDHQQVGVGVLDRAHGQLHHALVVVGAGALRRPCSAGMPNSSTAGTPSGVGLARLRRPACEIARRSTPGIDSIGLRPSVPSCTNIGWTRCAGVSSVSRTRPRSSARTAQPAQAGGGEGHRASLG